MKKIPHILIAALVIGALVYTIVIASKDLAAGSGAFTKSGKMYPVTAARHQETQENDVCDVIIIPVDKTVVSTEEAEGEGKTDEQEASEEETKELLETYAGAVMESGEADDEEGEESLDDPIQMEQTEVETTAESTEPVSPKNVSVAGVICPVEISDYMQSKLDDAGIGWWMPYAICTMFQESRFNPGAVSKNGKDQGLLQYRAMYWNPANGDIFDYHAQINVYVQQTAARLRSGCSIEETISRHMMSDWGEYNQTYVDQVMQWFDRIEVR